MPPRDFVEARKAKTITLVEERPYYPELVVTLGPKEEGEDAPPPTHTEESIINAALQIVFHESEAPSDLAENLKVRTVTGGITNALYCVTGFRPVQAYDSLLIRIFGAEGMIDRDVETCTFAELAKAGIAPNYFGRFANGRVEGFLVNYSILVVMDLQIKNNMEAIAKEMAHLHQGFKVPETLEEWHHPSNPGLWSQLFTWMEQAKKIDPQLGYKSKGDPERAARLLNLGYVENELNFVKEKVIPEDAKIVFCHNDLLPANIMKHNETGEIHLIDFEYGGLNYAAFDIANHFNEFAGGPEKKNGEPDYELFPNDNEQKLFIDAYVQEMRSMLPEGETSELSLEEESELLLAEVHKFILANHLYWGLWAVNQASTEGTEEFDFLAYAWHRFNRYGEAKLELGYYD